MKKKPALKTKEKVKAIPKEKKPRPSKTAKMAGYEVLMLNLGEKPDIDMNKLWADGWHPHGDPCYLKMDKGWVLCQTIIKYEK
jgi:hypothetical protein